MSFKSFMERYRDKILPFILVIACVLSLIVSNIIFWILAPLILLIYFWRKYNFWVILGTSLCLFIIAFPMGSGPRNETINIANHLLMLGAMLGITSYGEKKIGTLKKIKIEKYLLPYLIIAFFVIVVGCYYGVWTGSPLGDDALLHAGRTQFIVNNFPNTNWYPSWFLGFNMFETCPTLYYFLLALPNVLTGISVPQLIVISVFVFNFLLGVGVYKFSRLLGLPWYVSAGFSFVFLSLPSVWGFVLGGAYLRLPARAFFVLSIVAAYRYLLKINKKDESWSAYLLAVFLLAFTFLLHPTPFGGGLFAAVVTSLMYLFAVRGRKKKVKTLLKVFMPLGGLVSCFLLPMLGFLISGAGGGSVIGGDPTLGSFESIFTSSNPILLPFTLLLVAISIFMYRRYGNFIAGERKSLLIIFLILTLSTFLFGWLPTPKETIIMAGYTYQEWFGYFLLLSLITLSSLLYTSFSSSYSNELNRPSKNNDPPSIKKIRTNKNLIMKFFSVTVILMIFAAFEVSLPIVRVANLNPDDPESPVYGLSVAADQIDNEVPNNFRLTATTRRVYAMFPYKYPQLELAGGRQIGSPHAYYDSLFIERVFCRYHEDQMWYRDERAKFYSEVPYSSSNFFSSMFWMDWYGVDGIITAPWEQSEEYYPTYYEYKLKPQYFNATEISGGVTYIRYNESNPIVVSTNASTVGVLNDGKGGEKIYKAIFLTLGELNLNSQWIIPLKIERNDLRDNLRGINTILVTSIQYQFYENLLQKYVNDGGNLVIMDYEQYNSEAKKAELVESGLIFYTHAPLIIPHEGSEVIAKTENDVVIYKYKVNLGSITYSSVSVQELYENASPVASAVLGTLLIPDFDITQVSPQTDTWHVSYRKEAAGVVSHLDNEKVLEYELRQNDFTQINFRVFFEKSMNSSALGFIQFELWNDGKTEDLGLTLISSETSNYLSYNFSDSSWVGWKTFSIPLASFIKNPNASLSREFDGIDLVIVNRNQSLENREHLLKIKNLNYYEVMSKFNYHSLDYEWVHPNQLKISMEENSSITRLLWKGSYDELWNISTEPEIPSVKYYYAGPGVMFVYIPGNLKEIIFTMPLKEIAIIGILISVSTFLALLIFLFYHLVRHKSIFNSKKGTLMLKTRRVVATF
jgi:hypothetical protein